MEEHRRPGRGARRRTRPPRRSSSRTTATSASGPASTTSTCTRSTSPNVTLVDCPAGIRRGDRATGRSSTGSSTRSTASSTAPGSSPSSPRCTAGPATRSSAGAASPWPRSGPTAPPTLFGMMTRGFPNLFVMPAPGQQAVVTVNYTQLAVLGAEFVGGAVGVAREAGCRRCSTCSAEAEERLDRRRSSARSSTPARHGRVHAVADQQRGPPDRHEPAQRQLRPRASATTSATATCSSSGSSAATRGPGARAVDVVTDQPVVVVTGGGGGIGAAIAEELGRTGSVRRHGRSARHARRRPSTLPDAGGDHGRAHRRRRRRRPGRRRSRSPTRDGVRGAVRRAGRRARPARRA